MHPGTPTTALIELISNPLCGTLSTASTELIRDPLSGLCIVITLALVFRCWRTILWPLSKQDSAASSSPTLVRNLKKRIAIHIKKSPEEHGQHKHEESTGQRHTKLSDHATPVINAVRCTPRQQRTPVQQSAASRPTPNADELFDQFNGSHKRSARPNQATRIRQQEDDEALAQQLHRQEQAATARHLQHLRRQMKLEQERVKIESIIARDLQKQYQQEKDLEYKEHKAAMTRDYNQLEQQKRDRERQEKADEALARELQHAETAHHEPGPKMAKAAAGHARTDSRPLRSDEIEVQANEEAYPILEAVANAGFGPQLYFWQ